ncbi:MAG: HNH endonuclease [Deltaproteobacteria bacterium]|nr:HNH endonuclease [Deltaproteobacteria bacterium]
MATPDTRALRLQVRDRAQGRCEYCRLPEEADFVPFEIDHIIASQHGGATESGNLAYACLDCNKRKGPNIASFDPQSRQLTPLYNPRTQKWEEHFRFNADGTISGQTSEGRATARLLEFNNPERTQERVALQAGRARLH